MKRFVFVAEAGVTGGTVNIAYFFLGINLVPTGITSNVTV